jgi:hypothetical protein
MSGEKIYRLDFHNAVMTSAKTEWYIKTKSGETVPIEYADNYIKIVYSTANVRKTHWYLFVTLLSTDIEGFIRMRTSNRGNVHREFYSLEEMDRYFSADKNEIEAMKLLKDP